MRIFKNILIKVLPLILIIVFLIVLIPEKQTPEPSADVGGLQAKRLSETSVSISIPYDYIEDVSYLIIRDSNGEAETYVLNSKKNEFVVELKEMHIDESDLLVVTMYNDNDDALGEYKEVI